jgi:hypothetical protein
MKGLELPEVGDGARRFLFDMITGLEMAAYAVATTTLLAIAVATLAHRGRDSALVDQTFAGLALGSSVLAFSLVMAMIDVLGFPLLKWNASYHSLGYAPLSVLNAFGMVSLFCGLQSRPHA